MAFKTYTCHQFLVEEEVFLTLISTAPQPPSALCDGLAPESRDIPVAKMLSQDAPAYRPLKMESEKPNGCCSAPMAPKASAKAAHVNMMTDTIIANLPPEGLRSVIRGLLGADIHVTSNFHSLAAKYLLATQPEAIPKLFLGSAEDFQPSPDFPDYQYRYRCLMGCGFGFESLKCLREVIRQVVSLSADDGLLVDDFLSDVFAAIDGDLVQSVTAMQKELSSDCGRRPLSNDEVEAVQEMRSTLVSYMHKSRTNEDEFPFARGLSRLEKLEGQSRKSLPRRQAITCSTQDGRKISETVQLGTAIIPRMFMGLWQFSSPAWGTASRAKINAHFRKHVDAGFIAYDMADHYGDAEVTFVSCQKSLWRRYLIDNNQGTI